MDVDRPDDPRTLAEIRTSLLDGIARLDAEMEDLARLLNDPRRLRATSDVIDRLSDAELRMLDEIISTAHAATGMKWVALVLITDDAAQVVSSMEQIPSGDRSQSYCQMVVAGRKPWTVENTRRSGLVSRWRSTVEYDVGAYAGVPVFGPGDECVGALCMFQPDPHKWTQDEIDLLSRFAQDISMALRKE